MNAKQIVCVLILTVSSGCIEAQLAPSPEASQAMRAWDVDRDGDLDLSNREIWRRSYFVSVDAGGSLSTSDFGSDRSQSAIAFSRADGIADGAAIEFGETGSSVLYIHLGSNSHEIPREDLLPIHYGLRSARDATQDTILLHFGERQDDLYVIRTTRIQASQNQFDEDVKFSPVSEVLVGMLPPRCTAHVEFTYIAGANIDFFVSADLDSKTLCIVDYHESTQHVAHTLIDLDLSDHVDPNGRWGDVIAYGCKDQAGSTRDDCMILHAMFAPSGAKVESSVLMKIRYINDRWNFTGEVLEFDEVLQYFTYARVLEPGIMRPIVFGADHVLVLDIEDKFLVLNELAGVGDREEKQYSLGFIDLNKDSLDDLAGLHWTSDGDLVPLAYLNQGGGVVARTR